MTQRKAMKISAVVVVSLVALSIFSVLLFAQTAKLQGLIKGRNGDQMIVQTSDSPQQVGC